MSQVIRKFKNSGKIEETTPELFERAGVGKYDKAELISGLLRNMDTYVQHNNLNESQAEQFRDYANQFIDGIKNGTITMKGDGTFTDSTGKLSSTGKFDKNFLGKYKDTANNALNLVGDYAKSYIDQMSQYVEKAAPTKERFDANKYLTSEISKRWYGGQKVDMDNWFNKRQEQDRNSLMSEIFNTANLNELYDTYDWTDTGVTSAEDLSNRFKRFGTAVSNNILDNEDYNSFANLGGSSLDKWFKQQEQVDGDQEPTEEDRIKEWSEEAKQQGASTPEAIQAYVEQKQRQQADLNKSFIDKNEKEKYKIARDNYFNEFQANNPFTGGLSGTLKHNYLWNQDAEDSLILGMEKNYEGGLDAYLAKELSRESLSNDPSSRNVGSLLDLVIKRNPSRYINVEGDFAAIPETFDFDKYTALLYNPKSQQYKEVSMLANDVLRRLAEENYDKNFKKAEGGVIKFQYGGSTNPMVTEVLSRRKADKENKAREVEQKAASSGKTKEQVANDSRIVSEDWTGEDFTRLASIAADIGSMAAAYAPGVGTLASAGLGFTSSLMNYGADLSANGFNSRDLLNLGANIGLDTVGLIPGFGSAAKGSKILKTAMKYIPRALAAYQAYNYTGPAVESMRKALDPDAKLTVNDWRNIAEGFKLLTQGGIGATRTVKSHNLRKQLATGNKTLTTLGGKEVSLTPEQLAEIKKAGHRLEDQEAALRLVKGDDSLRMVENLNRKWYDPRRLTPKSSLRSEYDFNKTKPIQTSQGTIEVPIVHSKGDKYLAAVMQQKTMNIPGLDAAARRYNDWKYRDVIRANRQDIPKPNTSKPSREKVNITPPTGSSQLALPQKGTPSQIPERVSPVVDKTNPELLSRPISHEERGQQVVTALANLNKMLSGAIYQTRNVAPTRRRILKEEQYNRDWDEAVRNTPAAGYVEPQSISKRYTPPTPTELYMENAPGSNLSIKDPNARYLWEMVDNATKKVTGHVKNQNLPHKKSNKKKKTSRDDRVTKKAEGGLIQFLQAGKPVGRIKAKDMSNWNRSSALAGYDFGADVDRWKQGYTGEDEWQNAYIQAFNGGEDIYDQLTTKTGDYFGGNYNYSVQDPLARHRQFTFRNTNQNFDDLIRNSIIGHGVTEGATNFDNYAGDRTGNRTLSRISADDAVRFNNQLKSRGLELYDKGNGTYRLRRIYDPVANPVVVESTASTNPIETKSSSGSNVIGSGFPLSSKYSVRPEDVLATGRMVGGLVTNNRAAKLYKEGLKPTLLDTFENTVPLQGNYMAKTSAERQAANLESLAARPRTSDASLQLAAELEASDRAGQARFQGDLQDAEMFYKTRLLGQQESDAAKARRVEVANRNKGSMRAIEAAKKQVDAAKASANYQQVIAPWLAGIENQYRQTRAMGKQFAMEQAQNNMASNYDAEYTKLLEQYGDDPVKLGNALKALRAKSTQEMLDYKKSLFGNDWFFGRTPQVGSTITFAEKGSKLTYAERAKLQSSRDFNKSLLENNKQFHKDIMKSKEENNKMIQNMSAITAALIKRGMGL